MAVDPTASPVLFAALIDASFAFVIVPLLLEEFDELDRFRVRLLVDELLRGFDLPPPD